MSQILFPEGYSILNNYISDQGWVEKNPIGCWFFIICTAITGFLLIFHNIYIFYKFYPTLKIISWFYLISSIIGSISLSLVGIITKDAITKSIHDIMSDLAFGGFILAGICSFFIILRKLTVATLKEEGYSFLKFLIVFLPIIILIVILNFIENNTLNQWTGLFILIYWVIFIFFILPESSKNKKVLIYN